jgi:ABC-type multidrug transport system ATPase subunit
MGPSGAGKTTMLSILAQKYGKSLIISGSVNLF